MLSKNKHFWFWLENQFVVWFFIGLSWHMALHSCRNEVPLTSYCINHLNGHMSQIHWYLTTVVWESVSRSNKQQGVMCFFGFVFRFANLWCTPTRFSVWGQRAETCPCCCCSQWDPFFFCCSFLQVFWCYYVWSHWEWPYSSAWSWGWKKKTIIHLHLLPSLNCSNCVFIL